jgi:DNA modification methylase
MPRKKNVSKSQSTLSGIEPPLMKSAKKVSGAGEVFITPKKSITEKPDNLEISFIQPPDEMSESIPEQKEHFQLPTRFGAVPVDEAPFGWEIVTRRQETKVTKFQHAYPTIRLPFQEVQRMEFGHNERFLDENKNDRKLAELFPTGANRLFFGDNLHVMRQLPSESIDLIYIDPPFFSGRNYNLIFGDRNEVRSFSDIWEGGMPGYLVWLNARLWEMKRLLKPTGSIFVHLDWHASHYVKVEMDKIFGYDNFVNEIVWCYGSGGITPTRFGRKHDIILFYSKTSEYKFSVENVREAYSSAHKSATPKIVGDKSYEKMNPEGRIPFDWWQVPILTNSAIERIGYPTQKPIELLQRIIDSTTEPGDVVADFFCGGGTTIDVAAGLRVKRERKNTLSPEGEVITNDKLTYNIIEHRRWIGCDQSRIAVALTADRIAKSVEEKIGNLFPVPDFTVEHWGIYEAPKLEGYSLEKFREFVVRAFGGKPETVSESIHGVRYGVPLYVGLPSRRSRITKDDVAKFAKAVYEERRANHGVMLGWNFGQDARQAAEILAARENKRIDFVRLSLVRLEDDEFREHIVTKSADYALLLSFIQPPEVRINIQRISAMKYQFDVSESVSLNKDGVIANVQWDFDHRDGHFTSTQGYTFLRDKKSGHPLLVVEYVFEDKGEHKIACSVQDDQGGERTVTQTIEVK